MKKNKSYGPSIRGYLDESLNSKMTFYKDGEDYTPLGDNIGDEIVTNNISYSEFDYTYDNSDHEQF
ncbi:hypothetical protein SAMN02745248_02360 [Hathewaya proteolytica DSM 3090]|uniref:Uncharacterized protein n=1 Tax=Hathewaya proteolytica DSM 3090 TaxID=1121331 RepID=A0A1M6RT30_9CLOT|nr:hypothetical protein [Hathewaya proteolytica]SHK35596.1 hypothetical protein SAMN02745248_02360 [Hathewaya proteolytica DSM 3090]